MITGTTIDGQYSFKLMALAFKVDVFCSAINFPNRRGGRLMARLSARDAVLSEGGWRLWVWLRYLYQASRGMARIYGIGKPVFSAQTNQIDS
jgi:hypothetical protein